jgi:hypothetical protein
MTQYWSVSHKDQRAILEIAKTRYSKIIGNIRVAGGDHDSSNRSPGV